MYRDANLPTAAQMAMIYGTLGPGNYVTLDKLNHGQFIQGADSTYYVLKGGSRSCQRWRSWIAVRIAR